MPPTSPKPTCQPDGFVEKKPRKNRKSKIEIEIESSKIGKMSQRALYNGRRRQRQQKQQQQQQQGYLRRPSGTGVSVCRAEQERVILLT
ncbi:uncharacterized protein BO96DRAFT_139403 [Aspergillus niger CBS 101883]|uniref:uncharacterized protein n=1 Tax=Aspergillus lacticoffeatus (strain CBS 101883) TaxID=1450533 RepID=UPI000D805041|nr:uncharacterized protein BO96DRAFT_139403 [Aspergillus niger CBS 101883]PYH60381.1 hypothetical protein BO96DRAFT_139403 [Aspergillus niger CBS 101883]